MIIPLALTCQYKKEILPVRVSGDPQTPSRNRRRYGGVDPVG